MEATHVIDEEQKGQAVEKDKRENEERIKALKARLTESQIEARRIIDEQEEGMREGGDPLDINRGDERRPQAAEDVDANFNHDQGTDNSPVLSKKPQPVPTPYSPKKDSKAADLADELGARSF